MQHVPVPRRFPCFAARAPARGFTLIEIVAVLILIAIAITVASIALSAGVNSAKVRAAGRDLVAALRYTRGQAIFTGKEQVLTLDVEKRSYQAPAHREIELPGEMELRLVTAAMEQTGETQGSIRFYPDGSSTGGRVRLLLGQREWNVEVAWLTGEIRLREVAQ